MDNMTIKKKGSSFKFIATCFALFLSIFVFSTKVEAESIYADEIESNDTKSSAQEILENKSTAEGYYDQELGGTYQMNGSSSTTDNDWFRVFLTKGTKYMTCGEQAFDYHIEDHPGNVITNGTYNNEERVFTFEAPHDGLYFVRIKGLTPEQTKYFFYVGGPIYAVKSVAVRSDPTTIKMTSGTETAYFDSTELQIPKDAVVSYVVFKNVKLDSVNSITLTNNDAGIDLVMDKYNWDKDDLESKHLPASTIWTARFGYSKKTSFDPHIIMYYLYPRYS